MSFARKNKILLVAKKEWDRFFGDRRMVVSALILPGVLLYFTYAFLAPNMIGLIMGGENEGRVYAVNPPAAVLALFEHAGIGLHEIGYGEKGNIVEGISKGDGSFLLVFPVGFEERAAAFDAGSGEEAPEIRLYYNSSAEGFLAAFAGIGAVLGAYERSFARRFDINATGGGDMADPDETGRNFLAAILPMFILVLIYHAAIASTTEAITGEKERGTLSTILITPITPMELAVGKIFGLSVQSFLCGASGALGILLSLPRFINSLNDRLGVEQDVALPLRVDVINITQYGVWDVVALIAVLLSCALFIVMIVAIVSIHAKTAKEAQMILSPMVILIMLVGLLSALDNSGQTGFFQSLIPIYNGVQSIDDILNHSHLPGRVAATVFSNLFFATMGTLILSRLFKSEKIVSVN